MTAFASNFGCVVNGTYSQFANRHQEGAASVAIIRVSPRLFVEFRDVYNQVTLAAVEDNKVVASATGLEEPIRLNVDISGSKIECTVDL
jgi:hypothetical protein